MTDHSNPPAEPASDAAARAAQLAAMSLSIAEALARLRAQRNAEQRVHERASAAEQRIMQAAARAAARRDWAPAMDWTWLRQASTHDLLTAWYQAQPSTPNDPVARVASARVELRLIERHPEAMRRYQQARADGQDPLAAMRDAATSFTSRPAIDLPRGDAALRTQARSGGSDHEVIVGESFPTPIDQSLTNTSAPEAIDVTTLQAPAGRRPTHRNRGPS